MGVSLVLTPSTRSQRDRLVRHLMLFLLAAIPVAGVLWALVNLWVALIYVVGQTGLLMFGVRQQRTSVLRVDDSGIQYEAQAFVVRTTWADIDRVAEATLPDGTTQAFVLKRSAVRWTRSADTRREVTSKGWDRIIPIDEFEPDWPKGRLAAATRKHRPDLIP